MDCTIEEACAYAGISDDTYQRERKRDALFAAKMDRAMRFAFVLAKKVVLQAIDRGDGPLAMKWLERRQRDRYHTKVEQEVKETVEDLIKAQEATTPQDAAPQP